MKNNIIKKLADVTLTPEQLQAQESQRKSFDVLIKDASRLPIASRLELVKKWDKQAAFDAQQSEVCKEKLQFTASNQFKELSALMKKAADALRTTLDGDSTAST